MKYLEDKELVIGETYLIRTYLGITMIGEYIQHNCFAVYVDILGEITTYYVDFDTVRYVFSLYKLDE